MAAVLPSIGSGSDAWPFASRCGPGRAGAIQVEMTDSLKVAECVRSPSNVSFLSHKQPRIMNDEKYGQCTRSLYQ